jgi:hypothetical protein
MNKNKIDTVEEYVEELKKGMNKVYFNEWGAHMAGPKWPRPLFGFNKEVTWDSLRHFADGIGDLNPLYRDKEYAAKTKYNCIVGPPTILMTIASANYPDPPGFPPPQEFYVLYIGEQYELFSPICEGDEIDWKSTFPTDIRVKKSKTMGSVAFMDGKIEFTRHKGGTPLAVSNFGIVVYKQSDRTRDRAKPVYTEEYIRKVYEAQDNEIVRGATPRCWEDVQVGEELTPVVRGPLTTMDNIAYIRGGVSEWHYSADRLYRFMHEQCGWGLYDPDYKIYRNFKEWSDTTAGGGAMAPYRISLMGLLLTNWASDDGFIWKFKTEMRKTLGFGVVLWIKGKVSKKYILDGRCCVDVDCWMEDQNGQEGIQPTTATIILPSREHGPVVYPSPQPEK